MRLILPILMILCSGCVAVRYEHANIKVTFIRTFMDNKTDQGEIRLPDGARLRLSGQSSQVNAEAVGSVAGAAARVLIGVP